MFCPKCGKQIPDNASFCKFCGSQIATPIQSTEPAPSNNAAIAATKKSPNKLIIGGIAAVIVIIAAIFAVWSLFFSPFKIDETTFPDTSVRTAVTTQADTDNNGELSRDEANAVTVITIDGATEITNLSTYFPNLQNLTATGDNLTTVDVSGMNSLSSLDLSGQPYQR